MDDRKIFFIPKRVDKPKLRIFFFPYAGGSANIYLPWVENFSGDIELVFVQFPGRGRRILEKPHQSMKELISELMDYEEFITSIPFVFFGHSLGSRVAYALSSRLLAESKRLPAYLIASGSRAPHIPNDRPITYNLSDKEFKSELEKLNGTPKDILDNEELMSLLMPLLRSDFKIAETYLAKPIKLNCPIVMINGTEDSGVSQEQISEWQSLSEKNCKEFFVCGDHFFINQQSKIVASLVSSIVDPLLKQDICI